MKRVSLFPIPPLLYIVVPMFFAVAFSGLQYVEWFSTAENRWYDRVLSLRRGVNENDDILLLNIDDRAVVANGEWPWRRSLVAEGLLTVSEFDPAAVVLDIEYTDPGTLEVDPTEYRDTVPDVVDSELSALRTDAQRAAEAIENGTVGPDAAPLYFSDIAERVSESRERIREAIGDAVIDGDGYLGTALTLAGPVYLPIVLPTSQEEAIGSDSPDTAEAFSVGEILAAEEAVPHALEVRQLVEPVRRGAAGGGFSNTQVDADGVKRAIHPFIRRGDAVFPQLVLPAYFEQAGVSRVEVTARAVTFYGGEDEEPTTVPRLPDGRVLIDWPQRTFEDSFRQVSFADVLELDRLEQDLLFNLREMERAGYFAYRDGAVDPIDAHRRATEARERAIAEQNRALFREARELLRVYRASVASFLGGGAEEAMQADADALLEDESLSEAQRRSVEEARDSVSEVFSKTRGLQDRITDLRERLESQLEDKTVFVGLTATSTTDIGVTPFDEEYVNIGLHASLYNMLLERSFLDRTPRSYSAVAALALALAVAFLIRGKKPGRAVAIGGGTSVLVLVAQAAVFIATGVYVPIQPVFFAVLLSFVALTVLAFFETEREKTWLHNAFEHYISAEFIQELVDNPEKLNLGGEERELTAMFTDVQQFTRIAEHLPPGDLVSLLNDYLSDMSDIILDEGGTIDKFEGDAVVAFFGAPLEVTDHPRRACHAAVRMKKLEEVLNERFLRQELSPTPILSRIGINTGSMLVGNLGTTRRMDYTILGHEANLASRLEGVNKQYGTWILVSEHTYRNAGDGFVVRRLDRVRMVGIQEPVRLYEIVAEKSEETPTLKEALGLFHDGLAAFEQRDWPVALRHFENVLHIYPGDGPASLFSKRCHTFMDREPSPEWEGVFNLNRK